jgi:predicted DNA-binding WGR domain protein
MGDVKTWKFSDPKLPKLANVDIVKKAVLQVTDIKNNNNKYYAIELHKGSGPQGFRVFTHYGRTDDLDTNPEAGQKECRYAASLAAAQAIYDGIYRQKTSSRKGYKELALASSKIGSQLARGTSSGKIDAKTLALDTTKKAKPKAKAKPVTIDTPVQDLVTYLYDEATTALTTTVNAKITAQGIETPLGVLTIGQIEKGEVILDELYAMFKQKKKNKDAMIAKSGEFYTAIPHRIGRSRKAMEAAVIDTMPEFQQKQDTLQLMRDMLKVNGDGGNVLFDNEVQSRYDALGCELGYLDVKAADYKKIESHVIKSQVTHKKIKVKRIFTVKRKTEWKDFASKVGNDKLLFHGSNVKNWVGILSRGILLPKIVVSLGVDRTDEGWLGNGIYFGDASCTAANYTVPGKQKTRFITVARVALGKMKDYREITYGLKGPPKGFHSCHGVRGTEFDDDEFVIYTTEQQRLEYLIEFTM